MTFRELSVADLIERLSEMPQHYPVTVIVNGTAGVITGIWCEPLDPSGAETPHVLIGEQAWTPPTVPTDWQEMDDV
jgi:hypothetical protein